MLNRLLLISFLLIIACSQPKNDLISRGKIVDYVEFNETIDLKGTPLSIIKENILPQFVDIYGDKIIFGDYESERHFYVYQLPDFNFLGSFGNQGRGPFDLQDPVFWGQFEQNKIGIYQTNLMKFGFYDIDKFLNDSLDIQDFDNTFLPPEIGDAVNILSPKKEFFIGAGTTNQGELFTYNSADKTLKWKPYVSDISDKFINNLVIVGILDEYKRGIIKIKPDKSMIVKTNMYIPYIDIYNAKAELLFSIGPKNFKHPVIDLQKKEIDHSSQIYYTNCFLSDNFIYALNRNCSLSEFGDNDCNNAEIHVFDWKGNAIKKYNLNEGIGPLSPFAFDEVNNKIYTVNPKNLESYFSIFNITN